MQLYQFSHDTRVKSGCCGWRTDTTYLLANSREQAKHEIDQETPEDREPSGLCASCMSEMLANEGYAIGGRSD